MVLKIINFLLSFKFYKVDFSETRLFDVILTALCFRNINYFVSVR